MTNKKNKKTARQKRTLVLALLVAATIAAGSTFAWFTSKDEVTNRLSASAKYDVAISENFQPPEEWVPGQEINKDAGATNTGNVDAFVRMWMTGEMTVTGAGDGAPLTTSLTSATQATNSSLADMNLYTVGTDTTTFYKKLSTTQTWNPHNSNTAGAEGNGYDPAHGNDTSGAYSEVQVMQAGGILAYAPTNAKYSYVTNQPTELTVLTSASTSATVTVPAGVTVTAGGTDYATLGSDGQFTTTPTKVSVAAWSGVPTYIDAESFKPDSSSTGLYLFARNSDMDDDDTEAAKTYEFSGYQFDGTNYWALKTDNANTSDYTLASDAVKATVSEGKLTKAELVEGKVLLYTATKTVLDTDTLKWSYTPADADGIAYLHALRDLDDDGELDDGKIKIDIKLANVGESPEGWTMVDDNDAKWTFYYNNDLESGDSTVKLVDSVTLNKDVTDNAYLAFDFDLNVHLDSIQVTMDENGNEQATAVKDGWTTTDSHVTAAKGTATDAPDIASITWAKS